jgi:putative SOS response-associated peptidase YedK
MCGRFTQQASWEQYYNALRGFLGPAHQAWKAPAEPVTPRYNLAPTQMAPIIIRDGDGLEGVMALGFRAVVP